jgi:hypothetical protein
MQAAVERVIRSFILKQAIPDTASRAIDNGTQDDATPFAAQLLENYRDHLAQRSQQADSRRQD